MSAETVTTETTSAQQTTADPPPATRPVRKRAAPAKTSTSTSAKQADPVKTPKPAKASNDEQPEPSTDQLTPIDDLVRTVLELDYLVDTKSYSVFSPPDGSGCVGKLYAPLGTTNVKVLLVQPPN